MEAERRGRGDLKQQVLTVLLASDVPMTPAQVRDAIDADLAYTTVMTVLNRLSGHCLRHDQPCRAKLQQAPPHATHQSIGRNVFRAALERLLNQGLGGQAFRHRGGDDRIDRGQSGRWDTAGQSGRSALCKKQGRRCGTSQRQRQAQPHGSTAAGRTIRTEFCWPAPKPSST